MLCIDSLRCDGSDGGFGQRIFLPKKHNMAQASKPCDGGSSKAGSIFSFSSTYTCLGEEGGHFTDDLCPAPLIVSGLMVPSQNKNKSSESRFLSMSASASTLRPDLEGRMC
jgi:hypothetical protein